MLRRRPRAVGGAQLAGRSWRNAAGGALGQGSQPARRGPAWLPRTDISSPVALRRRSLDEERRRWPVQGHIERGVG